MIVDIMGVWLICFYDKHLSSMREGLCALMADVRRYFA